jgi:hypothetical protein
MPSAVIRSYAYNPEKSELTIVFQTGRSYLYQNVPPQTYDAMKASFAKGEFFNRHIRDKFRFVHNTAASLPAGSA